MILIALFLNAEDSLQVQFIGKGPHQTSTQEMTPKKTRIKVFKGIKSYIVPNLGKYCYCAIQLFFKFVRYSFQVREESMTTPR